MRYIPNPAFVRVFEASRDWHQIRDDAADKIAETARQLAPVRTGAYRDSIDAQDGRVVADVLHAMWVEFGTVDTPTFSPLRRAAIQEYGINALRG